MFHSVPFRYNIRNLGRRPVRTILTIAGIAMVVFGSVLLHAFAVGIQNRQINSAHPNNVIVMSAKVEDDITMSSISKGTIDTLVASQKGVEHSGDQMLVSPEVYYGAKITFPTLGDEQHMGVVRGVKPTAFRVHPQINVIEGGVSSTGRRVMVGRLAAAQLGVPDEVLAVGKTLTIAHVDWTVAGIFEAPGTVFESEIWCDADDLIVASKRDEYSVVSIVMEDEEAVEDIQYFCERRVDLEVKAVTENSFYASLAKSLEEIGTMVYVMLAMVVFGGVMGGTNTMYAAVLGRFREIGTLRTLGFRMPGIFYGLMIESLIIAVSGGVLGAMMARLANQMALRIPMGAFSLKIGPEEAFMGVGLAVLIGLMGTLIPCLRSARMSIVESVRAI